MLRTGDWNKAHKAITGLGDRAEKAMADTMKEAALKMQKTWSQGLKKKELGLAANARITELSKGSTTPLVHHDDLKNSIQIKKYGYGYFVGIQKNAKSSDGNKLFDIAMFHEFGGIIKPRKGKAIVIPMTRKASRAGSPHNYPGKLRFVKPKKQRSRVIGVLVDDTIGTEGNEREKIHVREGDKVRYRKRINKVAYLLVTFVKIPPRPHRLNAYKKFLSEYNIYEALQKRMANKVL